MTRSTYASILATIFFGVILAIMDGSWLVDTFAEKPHVLAAYTVLAVSAGFALHGIVSAGASHRSLRKRSAEAKRSDQAMRNRIDSLDDERMRLLASIFAYGVIEVDFDSRENFLLKGMEALDMVTGGGGTVITWRLTGQCRRVMERMD